MRDSNSIRFITPSWFSIIWGLCVSMVFLVWAYQMLTIMFGGVSGGVLIGLLTRSVSVQVISPAGCLMLNVLFITIEAIIYVLVSRVLLEVVTAVFQIEMQLRVISEDIHVIRKRAKTSEGHHDYEHRIAAIRSMFPRRQKPR